MAELVDALDLKSSSQYWEYGFDPRSGYNGGGPLGLPLFFSTVVR